MASTLLKKVRDVLGVPGTSRSPIGQIDDNLLYDLDGNEYHSVTIGQQEWLVENFKCTKYADGTTIPNISVSSPTNKITTWVVSNNPFDEFTFIGSNVSRAYMSTNTVSYTHLTLPTIYCV